MNGYRTIPVCSVLFSLSVIKVPAFEPLARGRVKNIILSPSSQTNTSYEKNVNVYR